MKRKAQKGKRKAVQEEPQKKDWRDTMESADQKFIRQLLEKYPPPPYNPNTDGCIGPQEVIQSDLDHTDEHIRELAERHALDPTGTRYDVVRRRYLHWRAVKKQIGDPYIGYGPGYMNTREPDCVPGFQRRVDLDAIQKVKEQRTEERQKWQAAAKEAEEKTAIATRTQLYTASGKARILSAGNLPPEEIERMVVETITTVRKRKWTRRLLLKNMPGVNKGGVVAAIRKLLANGTLVKRGWCIRMPKKTALNAKSSVKALPGRNNAPNRPETRANASVERITDWRRHYI